MHALAIDERIAIESIAASLPARGRFWLDGHAPHAEGRWAFLGAAPVEVRQARFGEDPFASFEGLSERAEPITGDAGGLSAASVPHWVGYVAYDAAWSIPSALGLRMEARHARGARPIVWLGRYERLIAFDLHEGRAYALAEDEASARALASSLHAAAHPVAHVGAIESDPPEVHRRAIESALGAIAAGTIYQVNLARRWRADFRGDPLALWLAMRDASPVPLGFYLELDDHAVLARTMERFLRFDRAERRLWTSPIKGTIARAGADSLEARRLVDDEKERAEHSMIVDLMRNDLSRVAEVGSVRVDSALRVEPFAALSHLVSTVSCRTQPGVDVRDVLEATFPPGSITGTPKIAAMERIEREEGHARGIYTGALGHVDREGGLSLAVAIRTAVIEGGAVSYWAGGGLVEASDPEREIAETELKARVFLEACRTLVERNGI